jgi:hypothetical protein
MKLSLQCPSCGKAIANLSYHSLHSQVSCQSCQKRYGVVYGKLSRRSSIQEALLYLTSQFPSLYKRHYTLQITTADRNLRDLQFSIPGKADVVPVYAGDMVSVLYTMHGFVMKKLVAIANHTTGKNYILPTPVPSLSQHGLTLAAILAGFAFLAVSGKFSLFLLLLTGATSLLTYLKLAHTAKLSHLPLDRQAHPSRQLLADQQMIAQQQRIKQRLQELSHDSQANQFLIEQISGLMEKMTAVDPPLYSARLHRSSNAIKILKQQITNNRRLEREYQRTMKMIEIEIETSWIADQLPNGENFSRKILGRLAELKDIEDQNESLKLQLGAYEEVGLHRIEAVSEQY